MMNDESLARYSSVIIQHSSLGGVEQREGALVDLVLRLRNIDLRERAALLERDAAEADQLEHGEEDGDQLFAAAAFEKPLQADRRFLLQRLIELRHLVGDFVHDPLQLD